MGLLELFILAVGLSMDAFAVSVCKGLSVKKMEPKHALICGAYFGGFQALMPTIGYLLGSQFESMITQISGADAADRIFAWKYVYGSDHKCVALDRICSSRDHRNQYDQGIQRG